MFHCFSPESSDTQIIPIQCPEQPSTVETLEEMRAILDRERDRAGQLGSDLSLIVFALEENPDGYTFASLVMWTILARNTRSGKPGWFDDRHIGVVMPDVSPEYAARFAEEVCAAIPPAVRLAYTVFGYPSSWLSDYQDYCRESGWYSRRIRLFRPRIDHPVTLAEACV